MQTTISQIIQLAVISVFIFIIYKRKIKPHLSKKKSANEDKQALQSPQALQSQTKQLHGTCPGSGSLSGTPGTITDPAPIDPSFAICHNPRYDFVVVDYNEALTAIDYEERLTTRLVKAVTELSEKGYLYRVDFLTLSTAIVAVITYNL